MLDEPTAGLDADAEAVLLHSLRAAGVAVVVVSHRPAVLEAADRVVRIEGPADDEDLPVTEPAKPASATTTSAPPAAVAATPEVPEDVVEADGPDQRRLVTRMLDAVPQARKWLVLSVFLAFCATGASVALMAVSAWLLAFAALLVPPLFLEAPSVAVRFFAISRSVFRYTERLAGHNVALRLQSAFATGDLHRLARTTLVGRRRGDLLTG